MTRTGTYPFAANTYATYRSGTGPNPPTWTSNGGSVTITSLNTANRKISGTFHFTASATSGGATGSKTITQGTFTDLDYR